MNVNSPRVEGQGSGLWSEGSDPSFAPMRSYDAPYQTLELLLSNKATADNLRRVWFDPQSLSPHERTGFKENLKKQLGDTTIGNALVEVATNPLTYLLFFLKPRGAYAIAKERRVFGGGTDLKNMPGWLKSIRSIFPSGLLSFSQQVEGNISLMASAQELEASMKKTYLEEQLALGPGHVRVQRAVEKAFGMKANTLTSIDPQSAPSGYRAYIPEFGQKMTAKELLSRVNATVRARIEGLDEKRTVGFEKVGKVAELVYQDGTRVRVHGVEGKKIRALLQDRSTPDEDRMKRLEGLVKDGVLEKGARPPTASLVASEPVETGEATDRFGAESAWRGRRREVVRRAVFDKDRVDAVLDRFDAHDLVDRSRTFMQENMVRQWGDEEHYARTGKFKTDKVKMLRSQRVASEKHLLETGDVEHDFTYEAFHGDMARKLRRGEIGQKEFLDTLERHLVGTYTDGEGNFTRYMPRNAWNVIGLKHENIPIEDARVLSDQRKLEGSGRLAERRKEAVAYDHNDLRSLEALSTGKNRERLQREIEKTLAIVKESHEHGEMAHVLSMDYQRSMRGYVTNMAADRALTESLTPMELRALADRPVRQEYIGEHNVMPRLSDPLRKGGDKQGLRYDEVTPDRTGSFGKTNEPAGGLCRFDVLKMMVGEGSGVADPFAQEVFRKTLWPRMMGKATVKHLWLYDGILKAKTVARSMAGSRSMMSLAEGSPFWTKFRDTVGEWGSSDTRIVQGRQLGQSIANQFYAGTLGLNLPAMMGNLLQTSFHLQAAYGAGPWLKGMKDAGADVERYMAERVKRFGTKQITAAEQKKLLSDTMPFTNFRGMDLVHLDKNVVEALDIAGFGVPMQAKEGKLKYLAQTIPLKGFEKTEWFNRLTTAHTVKHAYQDVHGPMERWNDGIRNRFMQDASGSVTRFQFAGGLLNTPTWFLDNWFFDNPLLRQYLSFPIRMLTGTFETSRHIGSGIDPKESSWMPLLSTVGRMLGMSAVIYEVGKEALGVDLSRYLAANSMVGPLAGLGETREMPFPWPPAVDFAYGMFRGLSQGDKDALIQAASTIVPGGVAIRRALEAAPDLGIDLQKRYAAWSQIGPDGTVPVFDANGYLVAQRSPTELLLHAIGADMGQWTDTNEAVSFLQKNRKRITEARRDYVSALLANDPGKAGQVASTFQREFGIPLTVRQDEIRRAQAVRSQTVVQRAMAGMPTAVRPGFAGAVGLAVGASDEGGPAPSASLPM